VYLGLGLSCEEGYAYDAAVVQGVTAANISGIGVGTLIAMIVWNDCQSYGT
jgi:hypothetical protein